MDLIIYGFGSIGAVLGNAIKSSETKPKNTVHLVGRKQIIDLIRENGLKYKHYNESSENITTGYSVYTNIDEVPAADVIFLTMKASDLVNSLEMAKNVIKKHNPYIVIAMNGLGLREIVRRYTSDTKIVELSVNYPSRLEGNYVQNTGGNAFFVSEDIPKNIELFENIFGINSKIQISRGKMLPINDIFRHEKDFAVIQWKKAIANIGMNAISAISMLKVGEVLERYTLVSLMKNVVNEAIEVANKLYIDFKMDMFKWFIEFASKDPTHKTSTFQDIIKHKKTEIDFMNGYIVSKGRELGIPTPANEAITSLMHIIEKDFY